MAALWIEMSTGWNNRNRTCPDLHIYTGINDILTIAGKVTKDGPGRSRVVCIGDQAFEAIAKAVISYTAVL